MRGESRWVATVSASAPTADRVRLLREPRGDLLEARVGEVVAAEIEGLDLDLWAQRAEAPIVGCFYCCFQGFYYFLGRSGCLGGLYVGAFRAFETPKLVEGCHLTTGLVQGLAECQI